MYLAIYLARSTNLPEGLYVLLALISSNKWPVLDHKSYPTWPYNTKQKLNIL